MTRVWCPHCKAVRNMYPHRNKKEKILYWNTSIFDCKHKLTTPQIKKNRIHVRWFLEDGTELVSRFKKPNWVLIKPK